MKKILLKFLTVLIALQGAYGGLILLPTPARAAEGGYEIPPVVINEVMWQGTSVSDNDKWIELYSEDGFTVPDGGYTLAVSSSSASESRREIEIPAGTVFEQGGLLLIANRHTLPTAREIVPDIQLEINTSWISVNCLSANIQLLNEASEVIDSVGCDGSDYFYPGGSSTKHALERNVIIEDGQYPTSWHERTAGWANIKDSAVEEDNRGTPGAPNVNAPDVSVASVADGVAADIDSQMSLAELRANWTGFADLGAGSYEVAVGSEAGLNDIVTWMPPLLLNSHTFSSLTLTLTEDYFVSVRATNIDGITSEQVNSDGVVVTSGVPTLPLLVDVPNDNGGALSASWTGSGVGDLASFEIQSRVVGEAWGLPVNVGAVAAYTLNNLDNTKQYEFAVRSISLSGETSSWSATSLPASPVDNQAPTVNVSKLILANNKPGTNDSVLGQAGAVNESATINILDRDPALSGVVVIGSVQSNLDGSFATIGLGDNRYASVWLQAVDATGNSSTPVKLLNDIVGPNAPTLNTVQTDSAGCRSDLCRVELNWTDNGPDTASYRVVYTTDSTATVAGDVANKTLLLDLAEGKTYTFVVYALDGAGNISSASNAIMLALTRGVVTTIKYQNGANLIETSAVEESVAVVPAVIENTPVVAKIAPPAKAAEKPIEAQPIKTEVKSTDQDWLRIFVVVILLLIVAGGFYALSRSFKEGPEMTAVPAKKEEKQKVGAVTRKGRTKPIPRKKPTTKRPKR